MGGGGGKSGFLPPLMLLRLQQSLGSSLGKESWALPGPWQRSPAGPLCRLKQRETLSSLGKRGFLLPVNMDLFLVFHNPI